MGSRQSMELLQVGNAITGTSCLVLLSAMVLEQSAVVAKDSVGDLTSSVTLADATNVSPKFKLTYFNLEAAAEKVRLAFVVNGIDFEDNRIDFATWGALKPQTPWGQLPILEVDGRNWTQSYAMLR